MNKVIYLSVYIIAEIVSLYCLNLFYSCFAEKAAVERAKKMIIWMAALILYSTPNYLFENWLANLLFALTSFFLLTYLYKANVKSRIVITGFGHILTMVSEAGTMILWKLLLVQFEGLFYNLVFLSISRIVWLIIVNARSKRQNIDFLACL